MRDDVSSRQVSSQDDAHGGHRTQPVSANEPARGRGEKRRRAARFLNRLCWLYAAAVVGVWALLYVAADRWWVATVVMYGPRWVWALPLALLAPAALIFGRHRTLWPLIVAGLVLAGPVTHFRVPWRTAFAGRAGDPQRRVRVLTCNADGGSLNAQAFGALIAELRPDVVALQAWTPRHEALAFGQEPERDGWHLRRNDELLLATRFRIRSGRQCLDPSFLLRNGAMAGYDLETPVGLVRFYGLHLATPRHGLLEVIERRWRGGAALRRNTRLRRRQSEAAAAWIGRSADPTIVAGDFNMPTDSTVYRASWSHFG